MTSDVPRPRRRTGARPATGHPHLRADQEVRPHRGRRRPGPRRPRGRPVRLPRPQRLGQDDDGAAAARTGFRHVRLDRGARPARCPRRGEVGAARGRGARGGAGVLPAPVRPGEPHAVRRRRPRRLQRGHRRRRIGEALERVGLASVGRKPVGAYSLGMRGRLGLAAALLRAPRLLVLDEPTNGLDPQGIAEIRTLLLELNDAGGHHAVPVQPPARRGGAAVHAGRRARPRAAGAAGRPGDAVRAHRPRGGDQPRRRSASRPARRRGGGPRRRPGHGRGLTAPRWRPGWCPPASGSTSLPRERRRLEDVVLERTGSGLRSRRPGRDRMAARTRDFPGGPDSRADARPDGRRGAGGRAGVAG